MAAGKYSFLLNASKLLHLDLIYVWNITINLGYKLGYCGHFGVLTITLSGAVAEIRVFIVFMTTVYTLLQIRQP